MKIIFLKKKIKISLETEIKTKIAHNAAVQLEFINCQMLLSMTTAFDSFNIISLAKLPLLWTTVFNKAQLPLSMTTVFGSFKFKFYISKLLLS